MVAAQGSWLNGCVVDASYQPSGRGRVTIRQVAELAGVSEATASSTVLSSLDGYLPAGTPALLDAYLWVKTPGQSDGQCDAAGGVRAWQDHTAAAAGGGDTPPIAGWPTSTSSDWTMFDPLGSLQTGAVMADPPAGQWFPAQALALAQTPARRCCRELGVGGATQAPPTRTRLGRPRLHPARLKTRAVERQVEPRAHDPGRVISGAEAAG